MRIIAWKPYCDNKEVLECRMSKPFAFSAKRLSFSPKRNKKFFISGI